MELLLTVLIYIVASLLDMYSTSSVFRTNERIRKNRELGIKLLDYRLRVSDPYEFERNPVVRWFMLKFGVDKGLLIHRALFLPLFILATYMVYKYAGGVFILVFGVSCVYLGMMVKQYLDEYWRKRDLENFQGKA